MTRAACFYCTGVRHAQESGAAPARATGGKRRKAPSENRRGLEGRDGRRLCRSCSSARNLPERENIRYRVSAQTITCVNSARHFAGSEKAFNGNARTVKHAGFGVDHNTAHRMMERCATRAYDEADAWGAFDSIDVDATRK